MPGKKRKKTKRVRDRRWDAASDTFSGEPVRAEGAGEDEAEDQLQTAIDASEANGLVVSPYGNLAYVWVEGAEHLCRVWDSIGRAVSLAPGDEVAVRFEHGEGHVIGVARRRTRLSRLAGAKGQRYEQVVAANVDRLIIATAAARPRFKPGIVDRYLVCAQAGGVEPVLCVNKMDLVDEPPTELEAYQETGFPVILTSCEDGRGLDEFRQALEGQFSVLAGASGVGKSSLLNALEPSLDIETREVSHFNEKGRHTTTTARLYAFNNIRIIDTPGIRKLGISGVSPEELAFYFPEIEPHARACKFRDCTHTCEPGCAVLEAVENGDIPQQRYGSYLRIRESMEG